MLFDETSPTLKYFQKPIFGKKTLLRNPDGSRTGASTALTAALSWMGGLSPLGSEAGIGLDNLIQGGPAPKYLSDQEWYQNNVDASAAKANAIGSVVGGVADTVRGVAEQVAGSLTGTGAVAGIATGATPKSDGGIIPKLKAPSVSKPVEAKPISQLSPTDPNVRFDEIFKPRKNQVLTPDQRIQQEQKTKRQMQYLPQYDESDDGSWRFYSDTKPVFGGIPNFFGNFSNKR